MDNRNELTNSNFNNEENTESFQDDTVRLETVVRVTVPSSCSSCSSDCTNSSCDDSPLTEEEKKILDSMTEPEMEVEKEKQPVDAETLKTEYLETKRFYNKLKGLNQYDLTEANFKFWKGEPYVGTAYRNFIKDSSKIMVCTCLINERIQINTFDKLVKEKSKENSISLEKGILKYVKSKERGKIMSFDNVYYFNKTKEFLIWRFKSHLCRFGFIRKYLETEYNLDYNTFKTYKDVETFFNLNI